MHSPACPELVAARIIRRLLRLFTDYMPGHTTLNEMRVINAISTYTIRGDRILCSNKEISERFGMPKSTVSQIVSDWEWKKAVKRHPHPSDGRRNYIVIEGHDSPDGLSFFLEVNRQVHLAQTHQTDQGQRLDHPPPSPAESPENPARNPISKALNAPGNTRETPYAIAP